MKIFSKVKQFFVCFWRKIAFFHIDISFLFIIVLAYFLDETYLYFVFIFFLLGHELSHYFVAKHLGYMAEKIHLSFFGASLEGLDDFSLKDEIKIVLSGPLFNLFFVVICYLCFWFYPETYNYLQEILLANLALFFFNMLPIFPLDFGRLILAFLTTKFDRCKALNIAKTISLFFIMILFFLFLVSFFYNYNFTLGFVCVNLVCLLFSSANSTSYKRKLFALHKAKLIGRGLPERNIYIKNDAELFSLFKFIDDYHFVNFLFLDENFEVVSMLSEIELYQKCGFS